MPTPSAAPACPSGPVTALAGRGGLRLAGLGLAVLGLTGLGLGGLGLLSLRANVDGPPVGHTGGFGEPTCHECHAGAPLNDGAARLQLLGRPVTYRPGESYLLRIELARPELRRGGFQLAARFGAGPSRGGQAGSLTAVDERVRTASVDSSGLIYASHSLFGTEPERIGRVSWSVSWEAPAVPAGPVVFHLAANASNYDDSEFGDHVYARAWASLRDRALRRWTAGTDAELRGLAAAGPLVAWAGGRRGTFARTADGGLTWQAGTVPGASDLFFIDVHAVDSLTVYLLGTSFDGGRAAIYKTADGGATWQESYSIEAPGVFFDGMAFWDARNGVAFSDPVDGHLLIVVTADGGESWRRVPPEDIPPALPGEAGFAASGTAITVQGSDSVWIGTGGGDLARVYRSSDRGLTWSAFDTPLPAGQTAGIFGLSFRDPLNGVAVGGDYTQRHEPSTNVLRTRDGGETWTPIAGSAPSGVRYGATYVAGERNAPILVATGPSGWGYSPDDGSSWVAVDTAGFNTVAAGADGSVWLAGVEGRGARWGN